MLHKAGKPKILVGSYRLLSFKSYLSKFFEKSIADNFSDQEESNKKVNIQQKGFKKSVSTNDSVSILFEIIKHGFYKGHPTTEIFLDPQKAIDQAQFDGLL